MCKVQVVRVLRVRDVYGVYVWSERGVGHHRPHAHIKLRATRLASVFLDTLLVFDVVEMPPQDVLDAIENAQELLLEHWEALNE